MRAPRHYGEPEVMINECQVENKVRISKVRIVCDFLSGNPSSPLTGEF